VAAFCECTSPVISESIGKFVTFSRRILEDVAKTTPQKPATNETTPQKGGFSTMNIRRASRLLFSAFFTCFGCILLLADSEDFTKVDQTTCRKQQAFRIEYRYTTNCPGASNQSTGSFVLESPESLDIGMTESNARYLGQQAQAGGLWTARWFLRWHMVCRSRVPTISTTPSEETLVENSPSEEPFFVEEPVVTDGGENNEAAPVPDAAPPIYLDQGVPLAFLTRQSVPSLASLEHIQFLFVEEENKVQKEVKEIACRAEIPTSAAEVITGTMMKKDYRLACDTYTSAPFETCPKHQPNCDGTRLPSGTCDLVLTAVVK
jgi:hypothetical protein